MQMQRKQRLDESRSLQTLSEDDAGLVRRGGSRLSIGPERKRARRGGVAGTRIEKKHSLCRQVSVLTCQQHVKGTAHLRLRP